MGICGGAQAQEAPARQQADERGIFTLVIENDYFVQQDNGYTNGIRLGWLSSEENMPSWARYIGSYAPNRDNHKRIGLSLGHSLYTPSNTLTQTPDAQDRPYAAWLYGSVGIIATTPATVDTYQVTLGMVGPSALGEEIQNGFHDVIDDVRANGWDSQLEDEPGIILTFDRKWKSVFDYHVGGLHLDASPHAGFNIGNIFTNATTGMMFRLGQNLPDDYGPPAIKPSLAGSDYFIPTTDLGWYLFAGINGDVVGRNIFLDGNSFQSGPHVDKKTFVGNAVLGIAATYGQARFAYNYALRTQEFTGEPDRGNFGAITVSYRF